MLAELKNLAYRSMTSEEAENFFDGVEGVTEEGYEQMRIELLQRQSSPLVRLKNGETMSAKQIGEAVKQASNEATT